MRADDPRHGTAAGAVAGCRDECCAVPRRRQRKLADMRRLRGESVYVDDALVQEAMRPWLQLGLSRGAIWQAAGLGREWSDHPQRRRETYDAVLAIREDDIPANATVHADLTRDRIYSLMAAGHRLGDMPVPLRGQWRVYDKVRVYLARDMRDHYAAHEFQIGPHRQTAARARNAGHPVPLAWDDPGTLAWPTGRRPYVLRAWRQKETV